MKIKISKAIKIGAIAVAAALLMGSIGGICYALKSKEQVEEKQTLYTYQINSNSDYSVNLNPNILYGQVAQEAGQTYLTAFVKNIVTDLQYNVVGDQELEWQGEYKVEADARAFTKEQDQKVVIWSKVETLVPTKKINQKTTEVTIGEKIAVDFNKYNNFAMQVTEASKVNGTTELEIRLIGNLKTQVEGNQVNVPINVGLVIPMQTSYFKISENGEGIVQKDVSTTLVKELPANQGLLIGGIAGAVVGVIGLVIILMKFEVVTNTRNSWKKEREQIKREHGSRMVAVSGGSHLEDEYLYELASIEDLVKVADEMQRPILYPHNQERIENAYFYVEAEEKYYVYHIKDKSQQNSMVKTDT